MARRAKILLIDDEPLVREELGGLLSDEGYEVITGADGEEGLELFRNTGPDMVITDVRMPRRDGLSVAMSIRKEDPTVPVTVITGHGNEAMVIRALRAGVTDFIKKPVRIEDLTAALARMTAAQQAVVQQPAEISKRVELLQESYTYRLQNELSIIPTFVDQVLVHCAADLDRTRVLELGLAVRELLINAIEHGNLEVTFAEKTQALEQGGLGSLIEERSGLHNLMSRRVTVFVSRQGHRLVVRITDEGDGFDWHRLPDPPNPPNLLSSHGRGILLARLSVDTLSFNEAGNEVTVEKLFT